MSKTITASQVIKDWRAGLCPRDPHDDLGILVREVEALRETLDIYSDPDCMEAMAEALREVGI